MSRASGIRSVTPEEKIKQRQERIDLLYLEDGKPYSYDTSYIWDRTTKGPFARKIHSWHVYIRQDFMPYNIVASESGFKTEGGAIKWARDYIKRGGPPSDYWMLQPPKPKSNVMVYRRIGRHDGQK